MNTDFRLSVFFLGRPETKLKQRLGLDGLEDIIRLRMTEECSR